MEFQIFWIDNNINDPALQYDNVIGIPRIFEHIWFDKRPYQIWRGSRFSAKSWTKALQFLLKPEYQSFFRGVYARNTHKASRDSQFQLFKDLLIKYPALGMKWEVKEYSMTLIHKDTGYYIKGGSFENSDDLLSVPEITDFWAEEPISRTGSITRTDFENIAGTMRNSKNILPIFHFTFNPIGKHNFIYEDFYDPNKKKYNDSELCDIVVNYQDNPFCPADRIEFLNKMKITNPKRYLVDGKGNWGEPTNENPYISSYDDTIHYNHDNNFEYSKNLETWITFDFNHSPCTSSVFQIVPGVGILGIKSYKQNGGTRKLCQLMKSDKELMKINRLLWTITGDSSGKNYTAVGGNVNDYDIIIEEFEINPAQIKNVHSRNKALVYSRRLTNEFLYRVPFQMSRRMIELRRDLMIAYEDKHGNLYKNRKDGYGMDFLDHFRYFIHAIAPNGIEDIEYLVNLFR